MPIRRGPATATCRSPWPSRNRWTASPTCSAPEVVDTEIEIAVREGLLGAVQGSVLGRTIDCQVSRTGLGDLLATPTRSPAPS